MTEETGVWQQLGNRITNLLGLRLNPVAITFRDSPPEGLAHVAESAPSGCTYWRDAARGASFYTSASDHYGCPVGAHTHGVDLPPNQSVELGNVLDTMIELGYLQPEEIPQIPRRAEEFRVAVFAPLDRAMLDPDVVLIRGSARQIMLLNEAAIAAGACRDHGLMGRPTCAALPLVQQSGQAVASLGCIGNRVYTDLADDELYFAVPGPRLSEVVGKLDTIVAANQALQVYHQNKKETPTRNHEA